MKSCRFVSYWCVGSIPKAFPLSALLNIASCSFDFLCIGLFSLLLGVCYGLGFVFVGFLCVGYQLSVNVSFIGW